jgi:hypothetical protein
MSMLPPDVPYHHAIAQLYLAVSALAAGRGDLRGRLFDAYADHLTTLHPRHMPEDLRDEYESLRNAFIWVPVERPGEGTLMSTLRAMPDAEKEKLAERVVELFYRTLAEAYRREA